jgi:predicted MFS family arabinose efflux permease
VPYTPDHPAVLKWSCLFIGVVCGALSLYTLVWLLSPERSPAQPSTNQKAAETSVLRQNPGKGIAALSMFLPLSFAGFMFFRRLG